MSRPCSYTQEIADEICDRLSLGESLIEICQDDRMPGETTVYRWLRDDRYQEFWGWYARAREAQADHKFDEVDIVSKTPQLGVVTTYLPDGKVEKREEDMLGHRRLRIDALKWQAAKLRPKYGDKLDVTSGGEKLGSIADAIEAGNARVKG